MDAPKTILVGVDGSMGSLDALRWACSEARTRGDRVEVLHCWHVPRFVDPSGMMPAPDAMLRESAGVVLADVLATVAPDAEGIDIQGRVEWGSAGAQLVEASKAVDLVVVGRRGHGGFASLVIGSVAHQLALHAHCPLVIVGADA